MKSFWKNHRFAQKSEEIIHRLMHVFCRKLKKLYKIYSMFLLWLFSALGYRFGEVGVAVSVIPAEGGNPMLVCER
jgi:hypothetical protein